MILTQPKKIQINVVYIFKVQKFDSLKNFNQLLVGYWYDRYVIIYSVSVLQVITTQYSISLMRFITHTRQSLQKNYDTSLIF